MGKLQGISGIEEQDLDRGTDHCENFYQFANGGWIARTSIPPTESAWGSFYQLAETVRSQLRDILEDGRLREEFSTHEERMLAVFYQSGMDMERRNVQGAEPIRSILSRLEQADDVGDAFAFLHAKGGKAGWYAFASQDEKQSDRITLHLWQGGLGLPDREYYLEENEFFAGIRESYTKHITRIFSLAGYQDCEEMAKNAFAFEKFLAEASRKTEDLREVEAQYHPMRVRELSSFAPAFSWEAYLEGIGIPHVRNCVVGQPEFFQKLSEFVVHCPKDQWRAYCLWSFLNESSAALGKDFLDARFAFYGKTLSGAEEMKPLWRQCVEMTNMLLGDAFGKLYILRYSSAETKKRLNVMVDNMTDVYETRIRELDWMGEETKAKAIEKLRACNRKLVYPESWRDYSNLELRDDSYVLNVLRASEFEFAYQMKKIGRPVDWEEWEMPPQIVNAFYHPSRNEILFPAAIVQPPFFDPDADEAVNYGAIGAVIGHELTHGFDDQGRKFDKEGNLHDWWSQEDAARFKEKTSLLVEQFQEYEVLDGVRVNGSLTLGENIADLGGLCIAFAALQRSFEQGEERKELDGWSPEQRFFLGWAKVWRSCIRPEEARMRAVADPHAPPLFRTNGSLSNMPEFCRAFSCGSGQGICRQNPVQIW